MGRLLRYTYWLGAAVGLGVTVAGLLAPIDPRFDMLNHFRPFTLAGCLGLLIVGVVAWRPRWPLAAIGLLAANLALATPALLMTANEAGGSSGERIKVLSLNLWSSRDDDGIARLIDSTQPDLVMLQEVRDHHVATLLPRLRDRFPYVAKSQYDVALLSRRPLAEVRAHLQTEDTPSFITALWTSPAGNTVRVGSVHLAWPFRPETQVRHIRWLTETVSGERRPLILAGDFNLTPWSYMLSRLTFDSGLRRQGLIGFSWPSREAGPMPPAVLIDHVLTSPSIAGANFRVHGDVGSDHRPVSVELDLPASPPG
jgi:endonuclease/exonuclease/phosphatase (EEP) superfamily protein YafD